MDYGVVHAQADTELVCCEDFTLLRWLVLAAVMDKHKAKRIETSWEAQRCEMNQNLSPHNCWQDWKQKQAVNFSGNFCIFMDIKLDVVPI